MADFRSFFRDLIDFILFGFAREREKESELEVVMGSEQEAGYLTHAIADRNFHTRGFLLERPPNRRLSWRSDTRGKQDVIHPSIHPPFTASAFSVHPS